MSEPKGTTLRARKSHNTLPQMEPMMTRRRAMQNTSEAEILEKGGETTGPVEALPMGIKDRHAIILLVILYLLQGVPLGLAFGSIPFILKSKASYAQIGLLSLCVYPYSLKLLWSPIVDSIFFRSFGRRKSWIVPAQLAIATGFWYLGNFLNDLLADPEPDIRTLGVILLVVIFFAATQDIAVDGWALTLLSKDNVEYASSCQTIGLSCGSFLSFTAFLTLNSVELSNKYFRTAANQMPTPLISMGDFVKFWAIAYLAVTCWLIFVNKEDRISSTDDMDMQVGKMYKVMWDICLIPNMQSLIMFHLVSKIAFIPNDSLTQLKLIDRGFSKEDMALMVLLDFPVQLVGGYFAGKWSRSTHILQPWIYGSFARGICAILAMAVVHYFPRNDVVGFWYYMAIVGLTILTSFATTVQFVGVSAFHSKIADPTIGATYMALLNTVSNLGGTWPKYIIMSSVDKFSSAYCQLPDKPEEKVVSRAQECLTEHGKAICSTAGAACRIEKDGYFTVSMACLLVGGCLLYFYAIPTARTLEKLPEKAWRLKKRPEAVLSANKKLS